MNNILEIKNLRKVFDGFTLEDVNITIPKGSIVGFIGENGAGKSTTIKLILNLLKRDSGSVKIFGLDNIDNEIDIKQYIGVVFDESNFPDSMRALDVQKMMKNIYNDWDDNKFLSYLDKLSLPLNKTFEKYSRGMKVKLAIAVALSHNPKFLILDEPTSGLDPIVREEILDIFLDFILDEEHSIFVSSHILSDLEKVADYIVFIHKGKIILNDSKDNLLYNYGILKCSKEEFQNINKSLIIGYRESNYGVEALVEKNKVKCDYLIDKANIEDIMLFYTRRILK